MALSLSRKLTFLGLHRTIFVRLRATSFSQRAQTQEADRVVESRPSPDPFGIADYDDAELSAIVQGIYSTNSNFPIRAPETVKQTEKAAETPQLPPVDRGQVYKTWLEEATNTRRNAKILAGGELTRGASYGSIRLDSDNVPREGQEEDVDDEYWSNEHRAFDLQEIPQTKPELFNRKKEQRKAKEDASLSEELESESAEKADPRVEVLLTKNEASGTISAEIPKIYQIKNLNDMTRADMWLLLRGNVVFQNDFMVALNKPYGLPIHSPSKECRHTMLEFLEELATYCEVKEVFPLHRLDKDTTGVLIFAKNQIAATIIKEKFAKREIRKKYLTITKNCPKLLRGTIDIPIAEGRVGGEEVYRSVLKPDLRKYKIASSQSGAKKAVTHYEVIRSSEDCAFMEVRPESGVKHQIRIHLGMGLGCPVLGDHKYSHREKLAPQRLSPTVQKYLGIKQSKVRHLPLHLHCSAIEFTMPPGFSKNEEPVFAHCRPPKHFMHSLRELQLRK